MLTRANSPIQGSAAQSPVRRLERLLDQEPPDYSTLDRPVASNP